MKLFILNKLLTLQKFIMERLKTEWVIFVSDVLVALLSLYITLRVLLGQEIQKLEMSFILKHCLVFALISFALFSWIRNNQGVSKYINIDKISTLIGCAVATNLFYHPLMTLMGSLPPLTPLLNTAVFAAGLLLPRLLSPLWKREEIRTHTIHLSPKIPVVIVGYNEQIGSYLRGYSRTAGDHTSAPYHFVGILLNHPITAEDVPPPFPVLGMINDFVPVMQKLSLEGREPKRLLITQESLNDLSVRQILLKFQGRGILSLIFEMSPASHEMALRTLCIEDLLGKTTLNSLSQTWQDVRTALDSSRVMIIGIQDPVTSRLAHHIAGFYPKHLTLIDPSERALAALKMKMDQLYPDVVCDYRVASITDHDLLDHIFQSSHPQVIIQGEHITHPDLVASNLEATIQKNILSPLRFAKSLSKQNVSVFATIHPHATTLLSQLVTTLISRHLQGLDQSTSPKNPTRFLNVHLCDIWSNLDSTTSFWPEQLNDGLEITMPSPDAFAYLLSADEAAQSIFQAIVRAQRNEQSIGKSLHLLGGEPFRFLDLVRSLALLKGLIPEIDVKVNFSGKHTISSPLNTMDDLLCSLVPGIVVDTNNILESQFDKNILSKLSKLIEKEQRDQIVSILATFAQEKGEDQPPLQLAG